MSLLSKIPRPLHGDVVVRREPCRICGTGDGKRIGVVDYWDIRTSSVIQCGHCGLAQLDPMLTHEETAKGCLAYYIEESLRVTQHEHERNLVRNYRRGIHFAHTLKRRGANPKDVLEIGPGSGYFLEGIKAVFPEITITVMDVNKEILDFNAQQHGYRTIQATLEEHNASLDARFDLIIARDILEHVVDVAAVIKNLSAYCRKGGLFHFITPNGHEDVWKHYLTFTDLHENSELLINHVNYFDGKGLCDFLGTQGFTPVEYYTYRFKTSLKGKGWKRAAKLRAAVSKKLEADPFVNDRIHDVQEMSFNKKKVLSAWYLRNPDGTLARLVCAFHHGYLLTLDPFHNVGHEIHGIFKRN